MEEDSPIPIDGSKGEGGGQLVRIAVALAAVTSRPIQIDTVRANREGGGLKHQHVTAIRWLSEATDAEVSGNSAGSKTVIFTPRLSPSVSMASSPVFRDKLGRLKKKISITSDSPAASAMLIFQAILPFLAFAGTDDIKPKGVEVQISGGTNVSFSPSFEYVDQVLLPALQDRFGLVVRRRLLKRGWSQGPRAGSRTNNSRGTVSFTIMPLRIGTGLRSSPEDAARRKRLDRLRINDLEVTAVDVSMVIPADMHEYFEEYVGREIADYWPGVEVRTRVREASGADARFYVLLVAHSAAGLRWGRDLLTTVPKENAINQPGRVKLALVLAMQVARELAEEVALRRRADRYLQDQLVIFQALAEGRTSFFRSEDDEESDDEDDRESDGERGNGRAENGQRDPIEIRYPGHQAGHDSSDEDGSLSSELGTLSLGDDARKDDMSEPFGEGSTHTQTARWVTTKLLPEVQWYNKGSVCDGVAWRMEGSGKERKTHKARDDVEETSGVSSEVPAS